MKVRNSGGSEGGEGWDGMEGHDGEEKRRKVRRLERRRRRRKRRLWVEFMTMVGVLELGSEVGSCWLFMVRLIYIYIVYRRSESEMDGAVSIVV